MPQTVTLLAAGSQPLNIGGIIASGDFTETSNCSAVLAAGSTCMVSTNFTPTAEGSRSGTLTITSNAGNPRSIDMIGFGLLPSLNGAALNARKFFRRQRCRVPGLDFWDRFGPGYWNWGGVAASHHDCWRGCNGCRILEGISGAAPVCVANANQFSNPLGGCR